MKTRKEENAAIGMHMPCEGSQKLTTNQLENLLKNALVMTEIAISLRNNCTSSEKYVAYIKSLLDRANTAVTALQSVALSSLKDARKLISEAVNSIDDESIEDSCVSKQDFESLLGVMEKHIAAFAEFKLEDSYDMDGIDLNEISEKIRRLAMGKRSDQNLPPSGSSKSVRSDVDEKYPGNLSKDSLIDLATINLPPVPEDIFSSFSSANKPMRSSSLSSLKSMRKVKLFLQKAESSDDEDNSSDNDDQLLYGDSDDGKTTIGSMKKLGNIKEETQDV